MVIEVPSGCSEPAGGFWRTTVPRGSVVSVVEVVNTSKPASRSALVACCSVMPTTSGTCSGPSEKNTRTWVPSGTLSPAAGSVSST